MGQTTTPQGCRIAVIGPRSRVDLCVPVHVPLIDLLPAVVAGLGPDVADLGLDHDGWVLQRLGEDPLDDDRTPADLGLRDGDTLHLRPRSAQLPPLDFDDLVDGVATGVRQRAVWDAATTRLATATAAVVAGAAAAAALLRAGLDDAGRPGAAVAAGVVAVLLLLTAGARLASDRTGATVAGLVAVLLASATGPAALAALEAATGRTLGGSTGTALAAAACGLLTAALAALTLPDAPRAARVAVVAGALGWLVVAAAALAGASGAGAAAVGALAAIAARPAVPQLAFRLAGLRLDPLPASAEDLQRGVDPLPGAQVLADTARAEALMTALYVALGGLALAVTWPLATGGGWAGPAAAAALATSLLLAARPLVVRWHRAALAVPGLIGLALTLAGADLPGPGVLTAAVVGALAATAALAVRPALAEQRLSPSWGRAGDLAHLLTGAAVVPLALQVLGTFAALREVVS